MKKENLYPMNLKLFGHPDPGAAGGGDPAPPAPSAAPPAPSATPPATSTAAPAIDYDKIAQLVAGKQTVTEDSVLKGYFKQQGLSQEEVAKAIEAFKAQKAASQPDVAVLTQQAQEAQAAAQRSAIEGKAVLVGVELGLDAKSIPYVLKMADFSQVMGVDGKINEEVLKGAVNKVLEDVPALKPQPGQATGFVQVGASSGGQQQITEDALKAAFGL